MFFGVVIALMFITPGLVGISRGIITALQRLRSKKWRGVEGKIVESEVKSAVVPRGGRRASNIDGSIKMTVAYIPKVIYEYRVHTVPYQSNQLFWGQEFPVDFNTADELVERYPKESKVWVFYDPENPEIAVLDRQHLKPLMQGIFKNAIWILIGLMLMASVISNPE